MSLSQSAIGKHNSVSNLIDICQSHLPSTSHYIEAIKKEGWEEVDGAEGETVITRSIWLHLPIVRPEEIKPDAYYGAVLWHQHFRRPDLGKIRDNDAAEHRAFAQDNAALLVFFMPRHEYPMNSVGQCKNYLTCTAVFGSGVSAENLNGLVSSWRRAPHWSGEAATPSKYQSGYSSETGFPNPSYGARFYKPDQKIISSKGLEHLNYEIGFRTEFSFEYMEPLQ